MSGLTLYDDCQCRRTPSGAPHPCDYACPCGNPLMSGVCFRCALRALHADLAACRPHLQDGETPATALARLTAPLTDCAEKRDQAEDDLGQIRKSVLAEITPATDTFDLSTPDVSQYLVASHRVIQQLTEAQATIARLTAERDNLVNALDGAMCPGCDQTIRNGHAPDCPLPADPAPAKEHP